ncbi:winged helix-turn-helix domain-containing protein [Streptomyces sp. M19]
MNIDNGLWPPGTRLPVERELAAALSVSVNTLRRAVGELVAEGIVQRRQGAGTFVTPAADPSAGRRPRRRRAVGSSACSSRRRRTTTRGSWTGSSGCCGTRASASSSRRPNTISASSGTSCGRYATAECRACCWCRTCTS